MCRVSRYCVSPERHRTGHWPQGRNGRHDCVQNSAIIIDDHGVARTPEAAAVGTAARARMPDLGRAYLRLAIVIRKGSP